MSDELDSLQSAYLDDEIDPRSRPSVEAAAASDPVKAEELRSLARVRDLVAGLSRPPCPDLAPDVLRRLDRRVPQGRARDFGRPLLAGCAAAAILATFLSPPAATRRHDRPDAPPPPAPAIEVATAPEPSAPAPAAPESVGPPAGLAHSPAVPNPDPTGPPRIETAEDRSRLAAGALLERPGAPRLFLVSAPEGPPDLDAIAEVLKLTSHRDFYRLELPRDGLVEPDASGAVVFAAELDPAEVGTLRRRLEASHPGRVGEAEAAPSLTTALVELGRAARLTAEPAAEVRFPQVKMALRTPTSPAEPPAGPPPPERAVDAAAAEASAEALPSVVLIRLVGPHAD